MTDIEEPPKFVSFLPFTCVIRRTRHAPHWNMMRPVELEPLYVHPSGFVAYVKRSPAVTEFIDGMNVLVFDRRRDVVQYYNLRTGEDCTVEEYRDALSLLMNSERIIVAPSVADHFHGLGDVGVYTPGEPILAEQARYEGPIIKIIS